MGETHVTTCWALSVAASREPQRCQRRSFSCRPPTVSDAAKQQSTCNGGGVAAPNENMSEAGDSGGGAEAPLLAISSGAT